MASRRERPGGLTGSAYVRYLLAIGEPPPERVRGWVQAMVTGGADNHSEAELVQRYGLALRAECVGFAPACDRPLREQSPEAQAAARRWAARAIAAGRY